MRRPASKLGVVDTSQERLELVLRWSHLCNLLTRSSVGAWRRSGRAGEGDVDRIGGAMAAVVVAVDGELLEEVGAGAGHGLAHGNHRSRDIGLHGWSPFVW